MEPSVICFESKLVGRFQLGNAQYDLISKLIASKSNVSKDVKKIYYYYYYKKIELH